jgi:DNA modification methylase
VTDPDAVPPVPEEPVTKPGDLWVLGDHRLLCGDATDPEAQARLLTTPDQLLVTDPPYGVNYSELVDGRGNQKAGGWRPIKNDDMRGEALGELLTGAFGASRASTAFVWFGHEQRVYVEAALTAVGFMVAQEIVWVKNALVLSRGADYHWRHEQAAYAKRKGHRAPPTRDQTTVWEVDKPLASLHPTQKPVELYRIPIRNHTERGEVVFDPFVGSGSLFIAAEEEGRRGYGIDIEPRYVDVSVRRWEDFTGGKAVLAE